MEKPQQIEVLISADGEKMEVIAHGFRGNGCEALVNAFRYGNVTDSGPTSEYYENELQHERLTVDE